MQILNKKEIIPAQVMYIVLNKMYSEFDFNQDNEIVEKIWKKIKFTKGQSDNRSINMIQLQDINIFAKYKTIKIHTKEGDKYMTKWRFSINYKGKHTGRISIYRNPEKRG